MFAIQKDAEYLPEFKSCMKERVNYMIEQRNEKWKDLPAQHQKYAHNYSFDEETTDKMLDRSIDMVMLSELREVDPNVWEKYRAKIHAKWLGREVAEEEPAAAGGSGGDDASGDDDGGDEDDE